MATKKNIPNSGFTLMEVMVALGIFSFFIIAFVMSHSSNINDSAMMEEEVALNHIAEKIIDDIVLDPPQFSESLTLAPETKSFDEEGYKDYEYKIEYKRVSLPNMAAIDTASEGEESESAASSAATKMVYEQLKKNIEEMLWQVRVTVKNKKTNFHYTLSTWLTNDKAKISISM